MTNTYLFAERELKALVAQTPDALVREFIPEILILCEKFGLSGQSGGSAPYVAAEVARVIKSLSLQEPICPIMNNDDEWVEVAEEEGEPLFQNNRCSALFKVGISGRPYYLDAIVFKESSGYRYTGSALDKQGYEIYSRQFVSTFPFSPKTFYVDVSKDRVIKYPKQLAKVFQRHYVE